jgi:hypothetical protein
MLVPCKKYFSHPSLVIFSREEFDKRKCFLTKKVSVNYSWKKKKTEKKTRNNKKKFSYHVKNK